MKSENDKRNTSDREGNKKNSSKRNEATVLRELFANSLKDIYWAEKALTKAIPKMAKLATSQELIDALNKHLGETEEHVTRLEEVFEILGEKPVAKKCEAMEGLMKEGDEIIEETEDGMVRDAGIIAAAQKIEHYEIATYGTLRQFAETLNLPDAADLLAQTLEEEKGADKKLTEIAVNAVNLEAAEEE